MCGSRAVVQETHRPESVLRLWFGDSGIYVSLGKLPVKALPESIPFLLYSARKTRSKNASVKIEKGSSVGEPCPTVFP